MSTSEGDVRVCPSNYQIFDFYFVADTRDLSAVVVDGQVGSGVYGTVFKAHDPASNEQLALKMIKMSKEKDGITLP